MARRRGPSPAGRMMARKMPLPPKSDAAAASPFPADLDPRKVRPSALVQRLLSAGRLPFAVVDYPRLSDTGQPVCKVHVRLLTLGEQDGALANARAYTARLLKNGQDLEWRPEELEHNARISEILAIACREPDDPERPFFQSGVTEIRQFATPEELGVLANVYASLASQRLHLNDMTDGEMENFLRAVSEGALSFPFSYCSREQLETLLAFAARGWAARVGSATGPSPTPSSISG